jgi:hypothetical protein
MHSFICDGLLGRKPIYHDEPTGVKAQRMEISQRFVEVRESAL